MFLEKGTKHGLGFEIEHHSSFLIIFLNLLRSFWIRGLLSTVQSWGLVFLIDFVLFIPATWRFKWGTVILKFQIANASSCLHWRFLRIFLVDSIHRETMDRDTGSGGPSSTSGPTARLRRRRGSNEVCESSFGYVFSLNFCFLVFPA